MRTWATRPHTCSLHLEGSMPHGNLYTENRRVAVSPDQLRKMSRTKLAWGAEAAQTSAAGGRNPRSPEASAAPVVGKKIAVIGKHCGTCEAPNDAKFWNTRSNWQEFSRAPPTKKCFRFSAGVYPKQRTPRFRNSAPIKPCVSRKPVPPLPHGIGPAVQVKFRPESRLAQSGHRFSQEGSPT